ncbi:MAG: Fur family transcriptional regulator [Rubripirellula sp.]|nr:Fur family transcriptional regulator [Rubripirellula sp.]
MSLARDLSAPHRPPQPRNHLAPFSKPKSDSLSQSGPHRPEIESTQEKIRSVGLRATPARLATLLLLQQSDSPLTHADVAESLSANGIDKATVFRNLNDLADADLLRRTELGDHVWRFEVTDGHDGNEANHPHFVCIDCGSVTCLNDLQLTAGSRRQSEGVGEVTEILLRGHCNDCR